MQRIRYGNDTVVSRGVRFILGITWQATLALINTRFCSDRSSFYAWISWNNVISEALCVFTSEFCHQLLILPIQRFALQPVIHLDRFLLPCRFLFLHNWEISCSWKHDIFFLQQHNGLFLHRHHDAEWEQFIYLDHSYGYKRLNRERSWQNRSITVEYL